MYKQYYQDYFKKCLQELKATKNPQIQKYMDKLKKDFKDEDFDQVLSPFVGVLMNEIIPYVEEEDIDDLMMNEFEEFIKVIKFTRRAYVLDVRLKEQENQCWRTLQLPATLTLAQLCYAIMSVFCCDGGHLFSIEYKKTEYYCDAFESDMYDVEVEYASEIVLPELNLRKGSHMVMTYDFGDNFMFDITVKDVKNFHHRLLSDDIKVLEGKGYGIWEDNHYMMDLYYDDPKRFSKEIEENGYDEDYFPINEEFDIELINESITGDIAFFMDNYENSESFRNKFQ